MNRINRKLVSVYLKENSKDEKKIFQYFTEKDSEKISPNHYNLFNKIIIINYSESTGGYFFYHIEDKYQHILKTKYKIFTFLYDLTFKALHSESIIFLIKSEKKENVFFLKKFSFNKFFNSDSDMVQFARLYINSERRQIESMKKDFSFLTFYEFDSSHFILMNRSSVILYEKLFNFSVAIQMVDLSFTNFPYPYINNKNEFFVISSEYFLYKLEICEKSKSSYTIFKDLTLNFNNEKYKELLECLKILIFYKIEVEERKFLELKYCTKEIFNQFDIYTYVENLSHVLNEENIHFFLSYNLKNYKLLTVFIFCLINENFQFLKNIFKLIVFNSNFKNEKSIKENLTFLSFLILFEDFLLDFLMGIKKGNIKNLINDVNKRIFEEFDESILAYLNNYIEVRIKKSD